MRLGGARLTVVAAALSALAAGCGGGGSDGPQALPSLTPSVVSAPSALPDASESAAAAAAARQAELTAAKAVVVRYFALINEKTSLHQARALEAIMTAGCKCRDIPHAIRNLLARGGHYFGQVRVKTVRANLDGSASADILVDFAATAGGHVTRSGRQVRVGHAQSHVKRNFLLEKRSDWFIREIDFV
jgi:hypothetical protein